LEATAQAGGVVGAGLPAGRTDARELVQFSPGGSVFSVAVWKDKTFPSASKFRIQA
jgi:hypothetical protein